MSLAARYGQVRAQATFIEAAVVAAHGAFTQLGGFRASDVRFFFLLFTNWIEHDVLRPDQDLDLTQVRRVLARLDEQGWLERSGTTPPGKLEDGGELPAADGEATAPPKPRARRSSSGPSSRRKAAPGERHKLTPNGLLGLMSSIVEPRGRRPFEESLFVACFVHTYRQPLLDRIGDHDAGDSRKRMSELLDPRRVLIEAQRTHRDLLADLEARVTAGKRIVGEAGAARAQGLGDADIVRKLEQLGPYQLQRVRTVSELMQAMPMDIVRAELEQGITARTELLFEPLAERTRTELATLERLARTTRPPK
jgi:hypothetical protein